MASRTAKRPGGSGTGPVCGRVGAHRDLPLPLGPDDRVHARLDDLARIGLERDLGLVARLHLVQFVLVIQGNDLELILHKGHHGNRTERRRHLARPQLEVDHRSVGWRVEAVCESSQRAFASCALIARPPPGRLPRWRRGAPDLGFCGDIRGHLPLKLPHVGFGLLECEAVPCPALRELRCCFTLIRASSSLARSALVRLTADSVPLQLLDRAFGRRELGLRVLPGARTGSGRCETGSRPS